MQPWSPFWLHGANKNMGTCSNFFLLSFLCIFAVQGFLDSLSALCFGQRALILYSSIAPVPAKTRIRPTMAFLLRVSFKIKPENRMVTKMLSLSMGTTTLAGPSCRAR